MQDLSYNETPSLIHFHSWEIEFRIYTFENVYTLNKDSIKAEETSGQLSVTCDRFDYAGGQKNLPGTFKAHIAETEQGISISAKASFSKSIRDIKVSIHGLYPGTIINLREGAASIPPQGCVYTYPSGWRGLHTPLVILEQAAEERKYFYARSTDAKVREKRFAFIPHGDFCTLELIFEQTGSEVCSHVEVPAWEIGYTDDLSRIYQEQTQHIKACFHPEPWESRSDVPGWMHDIALIASIHMEHWSGYTFHTYESVIDTAKWLSQHIDPRHALLYLPGWDGRYYWNYGHYEPARSMGGKEGFKEMMTTLRQMGYHVMLMAGMNMASRCAPNFEQWGASSQSTNVSGIPQYTLVDWDGSRHFLHGFNAMLSIGAPHWQTHLTEEIIRLYQEYGYDAMFLDISACWTNEQLYDDYIGIQTFIQRLHEHLPGDVLIAGEAWYDGLAPLTPLVQSGHTDGLLHWHDEPYAPLFDTWCRSFGHLCMGDPGRTSTGVHELGYNPETTVPYRKGVIPTITIVDNTIETGGDKVVEIIQSAKEYLREFLS